MNRKRSVGLHSLRLVLSKFSLGTIAIATILVLGCGSGTGEVEVGQAIYESECQKCHGDPTNGTGSIPEAPSHGVNGHTWHHADGQLVDIVLGRLNYPDRKMPSYDGKLTEDEVLNVLAYLKSSWGRDEIDYQAEVSANWDTLYSN